METNLALDPKLLEQVLELSGEQTKRHQCLVPGAEARRIIR